MAIVRKERHTRTQTLQISLDLLKEWGQKRLSTGQSLHESLTVGGVSLWEVVMPYLALYRLPELIFPDGSPRQGTLRQRMRNRFRVYRGWAGRLYEDRTFSQAAYAKDCIHWPADGHAILFLNFETLFYRETFHDTAEILADRHGVATVVLGGKSLMLGVPSRMLIQYHTEAGHADSFVLSRAKVYWRYLRQRENELLRELPGITTCGQFSLWPVFALEFAWLFRSWFPRLALQVAIAEHILENHRPLMLVSPDDADQARVYTLVAKSHRIPSMVVQQGIINETGIEWQCFSADDMAVFGPKSRDALRHHGVPLERIHVTGYPILDSLKQLPESLTQQVRTELGIPEGYPMVLFASQAYVYGAFANPEARRQMLTAIGEAAKAVPELFLVVKAHPTAERESELRGLIGVGPRIVYVNPTADIQRFIRACDVFVTFFSTCGLQALIAGKPMITVRWPGSKTDNMFGKSDAVWTATSTDELICHLRLLIGTARDQAMAERESAIRQFVHEWTYRPDGRAAERVADVLLSLMN